MIVVVDERKLVKEGYTALFGREGIPSTGFDPAEFGEWVNTAADSDIAAIEAFLIGQADTTYELPRTIRDRSQAPVIAVSDQHSLDATLALFDCGVDDVVRKPVHPREILARAAAIRRRLNVITQFTDVGPIRVFSDGRDPEVTGEVFPLPRRERRILEYLIANRGRRVSKAQIFNAIYGIFDEEVEENVVESHISKLRKKLRKKLGFDPIDSKRFLGYCIGLVLNGIAGSKRPRFLFIHFSNIILEDRPAPVFFVSGLRYVSMSPNRAEIFRGGENRQPHARPAS